MTKDKQSNQSLAGEVCQALGKKTPEWVLSAIRRGWTGMFDEDWGTECVNCKKNLWVHAYYDAGCPNQPPGGLRSIFEIYE